MVMEPTIQHEQVEHVDLAWAWCADCGRTVTVPTAVIQTRQRIMCGPCERDWRHWIEHQQDVVAARDVGR
jgi:hypothetical protein